MEMYIPLSKFSELRVKGAGNQSRLRFWEFTPGAYCVEVAPRRLRMFPQ